MKTAIGVEGGIQIGFALEYSLGHVTHAENLKRTISQGSKISPVYVELDYNDYSKAWQRLPGMCSNWSLRASYGAYRGLAPHKSRLQAALFHTQVTSLLSPGLMRRVPSVVSLDATPEQYDAMGAHYGHVVGTGPLEQFKKKMNQRAFAAARHLIAWSEWAKSSLVKDYGVSADKITVIPPGINTQAWDFGRERELRQKKQHETNFLFVGADFARKGGDNLLEAFAQLPADISARLSIVTKSDIEPVVEEVKRRTSAPINILKGLKPNSPELLRCFAEADVFVFPSRADCLPLAVMEALAAGLPVITTDVGALGEAVQHQVCGLIVPPTDSQALAKAMEEIARDRDRCVQMGLTSREVAMARFDAKTNYGKLVNTIEAYAKS